MERLRTIAWPGQVGRLRDEQIARISTWAGVPDSQQQAAAMHTITVIPKNGSTETVVNPLDPGDSPDTTWHEYPDVPYAPVFRNRTMR